MFGLRTAQRRRWTKSMCTCPTSCCRTSTCPSSMVLNSREEFDKDGEPEYALSRIAVFRGRAWRPRLNKPVSIRLSQSLRDRWNLGSPLQDAKAPSVSGPLNAIAGGRTGPVLLHAGIDGPEWALLWIRCDVSSRPGRAAPFTGSSMSMAMVRVRKMFVGMGHRLVMVPVAVTSTRCNGQ